MATTTLSLFTVLQLPSTISLVIVLKQQQQQQQQHSHGTIVDGWCALSVSCPPLSQVLTNNQRTEPTATTQAKQTAYRALLHLHGMACTRHAWIAVHASSCHVQHWARACVNRRNCPSER
jgi:hypothetical protein